MLTEIGLMPRYICFIVC